jgi:hypothetical protein
MADEHHEAPREDLVFRRGKLRRRDDEAITLFREAVASVADPSRVKRILIELGRFYNPVTNRPVVELAARQRIVELLEAGSQEEGRQALKAELEAYTQPDRDSRRLPG